MGWFMLSLRTMLAGAVLCGALVAGAVALSSLSDTTLATGYHENEGQWYVMYTVDQSRGFRLWLAGTRCFEPLPPWVYARRGDPVQPGPDVGRSFALGDDRAVDVITRLRCRR